MTVANGQLVPFVDGIWLATIPASILGMQLTTSMAVVRLKEDQLLLYSPVALTDELKVAVEQVGQVSHLYAPNLFHHLYIKSWADAFPDAKVHAPVGLEKKQPELRIDRHHPSEEPADFADVLEEYPIDGFRLSETVLLHKPSKTVIVADLVHNIGQPEGRWTRMYSKAMGFYDKVAMSKMIRWTAFSDKSAAKQSLGRLFEQPFDNLVVGHGAPIQSGAKDILVAANQWLM